ncbi:hypothetical protein BDF20DRAFT_906711 [Mycotypha africana]|uniref:uncharacterized protein n=1 Tax=Mycotypha africana TaxID=64632 RepID=UPI002300AD67|nr:uncharacterized protein BDF20DRAFT_906711 [Mycotypha africana]KAI8975349.1 hypothetical protein BDF20DRAFT_906711 [Mycotypha africana]
MNGNNIKVVVRCRPLNAREKARGAQCLVRMEGNKTILSKPGLPSSKEVDIAPKAFTFDQSYWSADKEDQNYADQERVYNDLGRELLDHAMNGYNCCIFAYGQTGSGKSYSMMGYGEDKGIIPRTCQELFDRIRSAKSDTTDFQVEVSYIEIYNEKVRDLLNPRNKNNLKVREHPVLGPYVQDLSRLAVNSYENIDQLMDEGNKARTVAATNMNETSSRSHAVFTIFVTQKSTMKDTKQTTEKVARISLVDLAGSERANSTGATGVRLKEGANINKSLTTLGKVIAGLAEQSSAESKRTGTKRQQQKETFIPFRDSVLTWLLKDSLGGNSKTCMIAAISPADYDETLSTLRYADQAKKIKTKAVINEDPNAKMMRELKEEVEALRQALMVYAPEEVEKIKEIAHPDPAKKQVNTADTNVRKTSTSSAMATTTSIKAPASTVVFTDAQGNTTEMTKEEMVDQLQTTEKLLKEMNKTWEEKLNMTKKIQEDREKVLKDLGITVQKDKVFGLYTPKETPYLINLNEDPLMSECLMYNIKPGITFVDHGTVYEDEHHSDSNASTETANDMENRPEDSASIRLSGSNISNNHCHFANTNGTVTLYPRKGCTTMVNGMRITEPKLLKSGYRIILGDHHVFRFNNPTEALRERNESIQHQQQQSSKSEDSMNGSILTTPSSPHASASERDLSTPSPPPPPFNSEIVDWNFARKEAMLNTYINESSFDNFTDEDLEKLFDDVAKVRVIRQRHQSVYSDTSTMPSHRTSYQSIYSTRPSSISLENEDNYSTTSSNYITDNTSTTSSSLHYLPGAESSNPSATKPFLDSHNRHSYNANLNRLSQRFSSSSCQQLLHQHQQPMSSKEERLARKVIQHWRSKRNVSLAKTILTHDTYVRQANELAKKAGKNVFYQMTVIETQLGANAISLYDGSTHHHQQQQRSISAQIVTDVDLMKVRKPCIAVKVIDLDHQSSYIWSTEKFMARFRCLQGGGAYFASDHRKKYVKRGEDLFYNNDIPAYVLVGFAKVPSRNLATQVPVESSLSIHCQSTGECMGQLKVLVAPIARSVRHTVLMEQHQPRPDEDPHHLLHVGQKLVFDISITSIEGVSSKLFSQLHAQFRLSAFGQHLDGVFATEPVLCHSSTIYLNYHQTLSMAITEEVLNAIETQNLIFELYGKPTTEYLERQIRKIYSIGTPENAIVPHKPSDDVIATIQICELTPDGDYKPVPVETAPLGAGDVLGQYDTFSLQQGQQRRISVSMSGSASLEKVIDMYIGRIRLIDTTKNHRMIDSPHYSNNSHQDIIPLHILPASSTSSSTIAALSNASDKMNRRCCSAQASWDSSLHDSLLINAVTPNHQKIQLTLSWTVRQDTAILLFEKDIFVHIKDHNKSALMKKRLPTNPNSNSNKRSSGLFSNFFATKSYSQKTQITSLFVIQYKPDLSGNALISLPHTSLPSEILHLRKKEEMYLREEVENIRFKNYLQAQLDRIVNSKIQKKEGDEGLCLVDAQKIIKIWKKRQDDKAFLSPNSNTLFENVDNRNNDRSTALIVKRWRPHVHQLLLPNADSKCRKGYLLGKNITHTNMADKEDKWERFWCVLIG